MNRALRAVLLTVGLVAFGTSAADATSVAYIDRGGVWVSSLDGKKKRKVSGKAGDGRVWRELAQADNGRIIAVRRPPKKIATLNSFTLWGPTGKRIYRGSLTAEKGWASYAFPLSLDLTSSGRTVVYGYSNFTLQFPVSRAERGTYVISSQNPPPFRPFSIKNQEWPTTVGNRLVTRSSTYITSVQGGLGQPPFVEGFSPWVDFSDSNLELQRTDVAANGKVMAGELVGYEGSRKTVSAIEMVKSASLGGAILSSCMLPTRGSAGSPTLSQDGRWVAWRDSRGILVAGTPVFGATGKCVLTRRPVVISKSGISPSIGKARVRG